MTDDREVEEAPRVPGEAFHNLVVDVDGHRFLYRFQAAAARGQRNVRDFQSIDRR